MAMPPEAQISPAAMKAAVYRTIWRWHFYAGLFVVPMVLILSLTFRTLDEPLCGLVPTGTHFVWHILNAVMLGWMIEVWLRHRRGAAALR